MFRTLTLTLALLLAFAATPFAQTVPDPRGDVIVNDPVDTVPSLGSQWLWNYGTAAPAPLPGTPFITELRLTLTPTSGTGTRVITLPRAQVTRQTAAASCPGGAAPCLRAEDVPLPVGQFNVTATFVTGAGVVGAASTAVPFTGSFPAPVAPGLRPILPQE